jgi:hypothetical protein
VTARAEQARFARRPRKPAAREPRTLLAVTLTL